MGERPLAATNPVPHMHLTDIRANNALQAKREAHGFTQSHIAALIGAADASVSNYETGRRGPDLAIAIGLELIFGCPLSELYPGVARSVAERILPNLQRLSVKLEWDESPRNGERQAALPFIADRLSRFTPLA